MFTKNKLKLLLVFMVCLAIVPNANAQVLKNLKKKAEKTVERKLEKKVEKETEKSMDSILNPNGKTATDNQDLPQTDQNPENPPAIDGVLQSSTTNQPKSLKIYTHYDFVAGENMLLYDDFSVDPIGDFPAKWNTNGSGEVVTLNDSPEKWLKLSDKTMYIPDLPGTLPNDYTLEFDMITTGLNKQTSSVARLAVILQDHNRLSKSGGGYAEVSIPLCQYTDAGVAVYNYFKTANGTRNHIKKDIRNDVLNRAHFSIAVNGPRFRMWINERKLVDLPRFIEAGTPKYIKLHLNGMPSETQQQFVLLTNLKLAEGGEDLRSKLLKEGKFSTTGILFDSGSDRIKPESYGTLKQIAEALTLESSMNIKIIGHTDADGSDAANLELSKKRATSVKNALASEFGVADERLQTDGKGENAPVGDNNTTNGKAKNRRVEFVKI